MFIFHPANSPLEDSINEFKKEQQAVINARRKLSEKERKEIHVSRNKEGELLSLNMKKQPTTEQLQHRETDALSALMSFMTDTGLGRMKKMKNLHEELIKIRNEESDGSEVPEDFKDLIEEIQEENSASNLSRIISSFKNKINKQARLSCCAACGMKNFEMGNHHFHPTKLSDLDVLAFTKTEIEELYTIDEKYRYKILASLKIEIRNNYLSNFYISGRVEPFSFSKINTIIYWSSLLT